MNGRPQALRTTKFVLGTKQYQSLLNHYATTKSLTKSKQLHARIVTLGLLSDHLRSSLAVAYAFCSHASNARKLFDELSQRSLLLYNTVIRMYVRAGSNRDAIRVFLEMLEPGQCRPDSYTYPFVAKACGELGLKKVGAVVHGRVLLDGFGMDTYVQNSLLSMYMSCGDKDVARKVFDAMRERSVVSWNTMISGCFQNGCPNEALVIFDQMVDSGMEPDRATVVSVIPVCGFLKELNIGREVHSLIEGEGFGDKIEVRNALIDMYGKCGRMDEAQRVFDGMAERDVVTWTAMINGYILRGDVKSALRLCRLMHLEGVKPNSVTIASLLSACAKGSELDFGKRLHGFSVRQNLESEALVQTALIDMYAKCSCMDLSTRVFSGNSRNRTAPWNAILSGFVHNSDASKAIEFFKQMKIEAEEVSIATLNGVLPAYAMAADLDQAVCIHCYLTRSGFLRSLDIATGLIDIYTKCGSLESARKVFNEIPDKDKVKDIILWTALISGYGKHGDGKEAITIFKQMLQSGITPNEITFTSVLYACSHAGLVHQGLSIFEYMLDNHRNLARPNHYTCVVDLLGRAGRLDEAYDLIRTTTFNAKPTLWGALLGACVVHENVELGEVAANKLFELEPENTGNYVLMAKIYAGLGRWRDVERIRSRMNEAGLRKEPAHSRIDAVSV